MKPYLTSKAKRGILWRTLVALLCFLLPLVYLTRGILMQLDARRLARSFAGRLEDGIPMEKLQSELRMHDLMRRLQRAIDGGCLQNAYIDPERNRVVLTAPAANASPGEIIVTERPSCGAKNQTVAGRLGRCSFCNQPLMAQDRNNKKRHAGNPD